MGIPGVIETLKGLAREGPDEYRDLVTPVPGTPGTLNSIFLGINRQSRRVTKEGADRRRCGLCRTAKPRVRSHFFPAGIFKVLRTPGSALPHPVHTAEGASAYSSKQVTGRFLCADCEQLFSRKGERQTLRVCARGPGQFLLQKRLRRLAPTDVELVKHCKVVDCVQDSQIPVDSLIYFAISIFWRSSAGHWKMGPRRLVPTALGPYEEEFRRYLLGEQLVPNEAALVIQCAAEDDDLGTAFFPQTLRRKVFGRVHSFQIPGILFELYVSKTLPHWADGVAINRSIGRTILLRPFTGTRLDEVLSRGVCESEPKGRLRSSLVDRHAR